MQPELQPLSPTMSVFVSELHRFSTDTILLAHFAAPKKGERCADFGTGCGAIPLLWLARYEPLQICGIDLQTEACELARRSADHCGVSDRLRVLHLDLRTLSPGAPRDPWLRNLALVACNPPYKAQGAGVQNPQQGRRIARHEEACTAGDIARAASACLRHGGRFCLCQRPERLTEILTQLRRNHLEPKRLRFVQPNAARAPKLFLLQARKNGLPGGLVVEPPLILHEQDGSYTRETLEIYGNYGDYKEAQP